jgi:hypothetical protein
VAITQHCFSLRVLPIYGRLSWLAQPGRLGILRDDDESNGKKCTTMMR